jgi:hypothetical protein
MMVAAGCTTSQLDGDRASSLPAAAGGGPASDPQEPSLDVNENPVEVAATSQPLDTTSVAPDKDRLVDLAQRDLAQRLKIDPAQVTLLNTMDITWPDISAACRPGAGRILTKGRVYGYRVWLEANGVPYVYHVGEGGQVLPCSEPDRGVNNPPIMTPSGPTQDPYNNAP